jgi:hypothetical protein
VPVAGRRTPACSPREAAAGPRRSGDGAAVRVIFYAAGPSADGSSARCSSCSRRVGFLLDPRAPLAQRAMLSSFELPKAPGLFFCKKKKSLLLIKAT